jgi:hypothetical protein
MRREKDVWSGPEKDSGHFVYDAKYVFSFSETGNQLISWERKTQRYRLCFTNVTGPEKQTIEGGQGKSTACKLSERDASYIFNFPQPRGDR